MHDFGYLGSVAVFTFGALTLLVLTAFYWKQRQSGSANRSAVLPVFTLVCGVAFLNNLFYQASLVPVAALIMIRNAVAGLLPPLILHLVVEFAKPAARWRRILLAGYTAGAALVIVRAVDETGLRSTAAAGLLHVVPAALLAGASLAGVLLLVKPRDRMQPAERAHRRALLTVLIPLAILASINVGDPLPVPFLRQLPDYLVLAFFCVTLYFRERLAFIDLLVKRGAFFAIGLAILSSCLAIGAFWSPSVYGIGAFVLALWLAAPAVYARIERSIDALWLRRPYSPADAERQFISDIQSADSEEDLRASASRSLSAIFRGSAQVQFERPRGDPPDGSLVTDSIVVAPRDDGIPFLSDDSRLLQSLSGALGVVLENVRFRVDRHRQEEREQELRWLTSRAELKALRAQINPHFLFNALSVITGLIHDHPELAAETVEELAQVFRYTLRKSESEWASVAEEVEFVAAYLRVEQARFGERLKVELDVAPAAARIPIPAMSLQPLIENAIKHGISDKEAGGAVGLRAAIAGEFVRIEVFDSGPGFPPGFSLEAHGESHGLPNVAERLRGYYGDAARLWWENGPGGTCVVLALPHTALCAVAGGEASGARSDRRR